LAAEATAGVVKFDATHTHTDPSHNSCCYTSQLAGFASLCSGSFRRIKFTELIKNEKKSEEEEEKKKKVGRRRRREALELFEFVRDLLSQRIDIAAANDGNAKRKVLLSF
jgi:hypothetical protein